MTIPDPVPVTMPLVEPAVATKGFVLLHVPPVVASVNVAGCPIHTTEGPDMAAGLLEAPIVTSIFMVSFIINKNL